MKEQIPYYAIPVPYDAAYRKDSPPSPVGPHTHNAAEIYLTLTDLPDVLIDDTVSEVSAGSLIMIPPFCIHQLYHKAGVVYERYILSIHPEWLEQIFFAAHSLFRYLSAGEKPLILPLEKESLASITACFQRLLKTNYGSDIASVAELISMLGLLDVCVTGLLPSREPKPRVISSSQRHVNEMISYINEHFSENIGLSDLAEHFYLNSDYLARLFKEHTHTSVGRYIAIQKITKAQLLLREGYTVTQTQETLGYSSYAHFAKTFRKLTGTTPGQYQKSS